MLQKLKTFNYQRLAHELRDGRMIGLLAFGVVFLLVSWHNIGVIQTNYELQKKIARLQQEVELQELENSNLRLRNQYYDTDQYLELQARKQFGKAAPGEKLLLVPENVALAHSVSPLEKSESEQPDQTEKPTYQKNFEAWMEFFFRRS